MSLVESAHQLQGKLNKEISKEELTKSLQKQLILRVKEPSKAFERLNDRYKHVQRLDEETVIIKDLKAINRPDKVAKQLIESNISLTHLSINEEDLEQYFLRAIRQN